MTDKEAMKLALFALGIVKIHYTQSRHINEAITALKERLAQPEQEPVVGTKTWFEDGKVITQYLHPSDIYIDPPQRTEEKNT
jgi:hypothetical protein